MASVYLSVDNDWINLQRSKLNPPQREDNLDSTDSVEDICRVCRGTSQPGRHLYHPCLCTGSIKYVHQDCLVQWLQHSGKKVCELCHHEFQFTPVYRPDMPRHLSFWELGIGIIRNFFRVICRWLHLSLVVMMWLFLVPTFIYRLYKFLMYDSLWSLKEIHLHILTINNIFADCIRGIIIVILSLITFVSIVWLKDQLGQGIGRNWFDHEELNIREANNAPDEVDVSDQNQEDQNNNEIQRDRASFSKQVLASIYLQSQVDLLSDEQWKLRKEPWNKFWKAEIEVMYKMKYDILQYYDLLLLSRTMVYESTQRYDMSIDDKEQVILTLFDATQRCDEKILLELCQSIQGVRTSRENIMKEADEHSSMICKLLSMHSESPDSDPIFESTDSVNDAERKAIIQIRKLKSHIKYGKNNSHLDQSSNIPGQLDHIQDRQRENQNINVQRPNNRHPHIGHAIAGLAREGDLEDVEELTWARLLGLDGSFRFLEHVFWLLCLNSLLIFAFVYLPFQLGNFATKSLPFFTVWKSMTWETAKSVVFGYGIISMCLLLLYYCAGRLNVPKIKRTLATVIITIKVGVILIIEAGVFPLICGWWMDICSFGLFNSSITLRQKSMFRASGAVMFLHWLAGIIFIFYLASFVMLLREVLRPGVLWFLRNLNDQNFHPINEMINLPFQRHIRRFFMSCVLFGVCIVMVLLLPTTIIKIILPSFLPFKISMSSLSPYPVREIYIELILLQFVIPALIEHGNCKIALKSLVQIWAISAANLMGMQSYLLDEAQAGGVIVDVYGQILHEIPSQHNQNGPVHGRIQHLGAGFPPFKPYLRPHYFFFRVFCLLIYTLLAVLCVSTVILSIPVLVGRHLLALISVTNGSEIYTAALGFYVIWIVTRILLFIIPYARGGIISVVKHIPSWMWTLVKCSIAATLLLIIIPLCMGILADMLLICTLRVPLYKTPLFYSSTEWALGLLHTKCVCGIIWLSNMNMKDTLDEIYNAGVRNINFKNIVIKLAWPVISLLSIILLLPYLLFVGCLYHIFGVLSYANSIIFYRYTFPVSLVGIVIIFLFYIFCLQCKKLYGHVRNQRYLMGQQLINYAVQ